MYAYLELLERVNRGGEWVENRTGMRDEYIVCWEVRSF